MGTPAGVALTEMAASCGRFRLIADQAEDELMVRLRRGQGLYKIGLLNGVDEVGDGERGGDELRGVGDNVVLGDLSALNDDGGDAVETIEGGLSS